MIRKAELNDLKRLAELFRELHRCHCEIAPNKHRMPRDDFFLERLSAMLSDDEFTALVNDDNGINGYALLRIIDVNSEEKIQRRVCFIDCFAVSESFRRKGIGTALFGAVKDFARENGCDAVQLSVDAENKSAAEFYKKMGFSPRTIIMDNQIGG